jgi:alkylhydroperoxidase family enzyme
MTAPRVDPLPEPWSEEDAAGIGRWGHPAATYDPLVLTRILQRHPALADRTRAMGESIYVHGRLPGRLRTIAILRTCAAIDCAYEWGGQAAFWGPMTEVTEEECDAIATGPAHDGRWGAAELAVLGAVDELEATGSWSDATWARLAEHLDDEQRIELLIVGGWYRTISSICNALRLPNEPWFRPWPDA